MKINIRIRFWYWALLVVGLVVVDLNRACPGSPSLLGRLAQFVLPGLPDVI